MNPEDEKSIAELYQMRIDACHKASELEEEAKRLRAEVKYLTVNSLARKFDCTRGQIVGALGRQGIGVDTPSVKRQSGFIKPTVDEVKEFVQKHGYTINPQAFVDFYEMKGWMVGKNKMKDWQAAVRTWQQREGSKPRAEQVNYQPKIHQAQPTEKAPVDEEKRRQLREALKNPKAGEAKGFGG